VVVQSLKHYVGSAVFFFVCALLGGDGSVNKSPRIERLAVRWQPGWMRGEEYGVSASLESGPSRELILFLLKVGVVCRIESGLPSEKGG
jgi:hypothetical protein